MRGRGKSRRVCSRVYWLHKGSWYCRQGLARHSLSHRRCLCLDALRLQLAKMMDDDDDDDGTCKLVLDCYCSPPALPYHA